ncbi:hypothetical protein ACFFHC_06885 [Kytococcus schroeteri]|uniref:hypothetical protein n=1 Tax=Kytococcus schroeteri TaxID=138300 RepID=UPI0035E7DDB0
MTDTDGFTAFSQMLDAREERRRLGQAAYEALKATGRLKHHRVLTYRCKTRGCLLLDVLQLPAPVGMVFYQPGYKLAPSVNAARSTEAGRRNHTTDGDRRWKPAVMPGGQPGNYTVNCDHLNGVALDADRVERDIAEGRGKVIVTEEDHEPQSWTPLHSDDGRRVAWRFVE